MSKRKGNNDSGVQKESWVVCVDASNFFNTKLELVEGKAYFVVDILSVPSLFNRNGLVQLAIQAPDGTIVEVNAQRFQVVNDRRK